MTVFGHFSAGYVGYAAQAGLPAPGLLVPLSGVIAILGGLSITLGYKAKIGGWLIVLFLVPVTLKMHAFWAVPDPMMHGIQLAMFWKNVSRSEEHTSELQSLAYLVCRLLLEKKKNTTSTR